MTDIIEKKKKGVRLSTDEINGFIKGVTDGSIPDYQTSALLMAMCFNPPGEDETFDLTSAMTRSGDVADLSEIDAVKVDKHSTGGVGDKTTLIVAPMVAAAKMGVCVAKMSGRGLGHTGGTVDKLESVPGIDTSPDTRKFMSVVRECGLCVIGQSGNFAPADKKLYALRDVTATVDCMPLIASSIMSKKLAAGSDAIVLDVKCGSGAFMKTPKDARALAKQMIDIGKRAGKKTVAVMTDMSRPLGRAVGNSLELKEAVDILRGKETGRLYGLCLTLAAVMLSAGTGKSFAECENAAKKTICDGSALEKLCDMVRLLGGDDSYIRDTSKFPSAPYTLDITADKDGYITRIDALGIGRASLELGAGRLVKDAAVDHAAGVTFARLYGDRVERGEVIATLHSSSEELLGNAATIAASAIEVGSAKPEERPVVIDIIE